MGKVETVTDIALKAAREGEFEVLRPLIADLPDVNAVDQDQRAGDERIVHSLIDKKAEVNKADEGGWTPLHIAVSSGHESVTRLLLAAGADPSLKTTQHKTALMYACSRGRTPLVPILLEAGAKIPEGSLHAAARLGHRRIVEILLENGAKIDAYESGTGNTALHEAAIEGQPEMVRLLLAHGADAKLTNNEEKTAAQVATDDCLSIFRHPPQRIVQREEQ